MTDFFAPRQMNEMIEKNEIHFLTQEGHGYLTGQRLTHYHPLQLMGDGGCVFMLADVQ